MKDKKDLIILTGPTAVGKTELSIKLAKAVGGEIISADSMQVYKSMDIGTAKITQKEMDGVTHYLIDCMEPEDEFNVVVFQKMAKEAIRKIYDNGNVPIIAGGTGFYIQAVLYDIDFTDNNEAEEAPDSGGDEDAEYSAAQAEAVNAAAGLTELSYRDELYRLAEEKGADYLHQRLEEIDPVSAKNIHKNNVKRVVRALEYYRQTGERISSHNEEQQRKESPYNYVYFVLNDDRDVLYKRIDRRVDEMFENGLVEEMQSLMRRGLKKNMVSMQGIGYKEMFGFFEGEYNLERAKELIKLDTRHFAKRQITWFKREREVVWINYQDYNSSKDEMLKAMLKQISEKFKR